MLKTQSRSYELIVRVSIDDGAFRGAMSRASGQVSAGGSLAGQTTIIMIYPEKSIKRLHSTIEKPQL